MIGHLNRMFPRCQIYAWIQRIYLIQVGFFAIHICRPSLTVRYRDTQHLALFICYHSGHGISFKGHVRKTILFTCSGHFWKIFYRLTNNSEIRKSISSGFLKRDCHLLSAASVVSHICKEILHPTVKIIFIRHIVNRLFIVLIFYVQIDRSRLFQFLLLWLIIHIFHNQIYFTFIQAIKL